MTINTPPLGWNTWNTFGANINEQLIIEAADAMVASGLRDAGYSYVVIDDIWALRKRDKNGRLVADPEKFPHGMKYLADYIHSKGLKFGMYSCSGYLTCAGYPGSYEYEWIDAATFAEWNIDFLKYDYCAHTTGERADLLYKRMSLALANCGRDIVFSACSWGADGTRQWIKETGAHMWRSTGDIFDSWESLKGIAQSQLQFLEYNGRGCYNDMDMLIVGMNGNGNVGLTGCTADEYRLHFSLWALLSSPLMIGCDIRSIDSEALEILTNKEAIAINQDSAACQPFFINNSFPMQPADCRSENTPYFKKYPLEQPMIVKYLDNGDIAIGIFNLMDDSMPQWNAILPDLLGLPITTGKTLELKDCWTGDKYNLNDLMSDGFKSLAPHSCKLFRARIIDAK